MSAVLEAAVRDLERGALDPEVVAAASPSELAALLAALEAMARTALAGDAAGDGAAAELLAMAAVHPSAHVRRTLVGAVAARGPATDAQRELLCWAVDDSDDEVALLAIRACERHGLTDALVPLADSLGRAPDRLERNLAGLTDHRTYAAIRAASALRPPEWAPEDVVRGAAAGEDGAGEVDVADLSDMALVPATTVQLGVRPGVSVPCWLPADNHTSSPRAVDVEAFYIDERPVTNEQYDRFVDAARDADHAHCHPDEPPTTDHARATLLEPWARPDHPVTGVSWFDAYSFASFHAKRLPSDVEWEYAAAGPGVLAYPWGDDFDPAACRWLGTTTGGPIESLAAWEEALERVLQGGATGRTAAPDDHPANVSPLGARDMAGNAWEWTRSRHLDGADVQPRGWSPGDPRLRGDWTAVACVKGGSWASAPDMLLNAYRGRMPLHRRSSEVGFRCVVPAED